MKGTCTVIQLKEVLSLMTEDTMLHCDDIIISGNYSNGTDEEMGRIVFGQYPFERADIELNEAYSLEDI